MQKIHLGLSLPFGLIISIVSLTGAAMVLDKDFHKLFNSDLYLVEQVGEEVVPMGQMVEELERLFPERGGVSGVVVLPNKDASYQFTFASSSKAFVFVNQYTGEYLGERNPFEKGGFYRTMFYTHRWLMDYEKGEFSIGKFLVGTSTLLLIFIVITGVVLWLPRNLKSLRKRLSISVKRGWRRFWFDLHVVGGVYAAMLLVLLALTGLMWSFSWYRPMVYTLFGVEVSSSSKSSSGGSRAKGESEHEIINYKLWDDVLGDIYLKYPEPQSIKFGRDAARVYINKYGNTSAYDSYVYPTTTAPAKVVCYGQQPETSRFMGWVYSIHIGNWGGLFGRILTFFVTLVAGIAPISGYYFWISKIIKRRRRKRSVKL